MGLSNLADWLQPAGLVALGGGATKLLDFASKRGRDRAYVMGAVDKAVHSAVELLQDQLERSTEGHEACQAALEEVRTELADAKDAWARERAAMQSQIDRLMQGEVPLYDLMSHKG